MLRRICDIASLGVLPKLPQHSHFANVGPFCNPCFSGVLIYRFQFWAFLQNWNLDYPSPSPPPLTTSPVRVDRAGAEILSKFTFGPKPDHVPCAFKLHTVHRFSKNLFFENLYKSIFSKHARDPPRTCPDHPQMIPRISQNRPKIDLCW